MLYPIAHKLFTIIFKFFDFRMEGLEYMPSQGGAIMVSNHISNLDPLFIGVAITQRRIHYMAKEELFKYPILKQVVEMMGAFPVRRGKADRQALKMALELAEGGKLVGIFPEGTRSKSGVLQPFHSGTAMIAAKAKVPIIPTIVVGSNELFSSSREKLIVRFGPPIHWDWEQKMSSDKLQELTALMEETIKEMLMAEKQKK